MIKLPIYLDYNATTPVDKRVLEAMLPFFSDHFGNAASRSHSFGWEAEAAVDVGRERIAALIGCEPKEIVFTSGATEADNLAIKGVFEAYSSKGNHIITVATEHKAVLDTCAHIERLGGEITYLPVNDEGLIDLQQLVQAIKSNTILIAVMYANNETGVLQPIKEIGAVAKKHGIIFFCDASQAVGKIPVNVIEDEIDIMAFSAHKIYGPKGVGALYVRRKNPRVKIIAQMDGGGHERGMRSGTLNVPGIVGLGKACEICAAEIKGDAARLSDLRDRLESSLLKLEGTLINGNRISRLPQTTNISFQWIDGDALMMGLNKNIALSSGSACTSASVEPSYVLRAMGVEDDVAHASLRFGLGRFTSADEISYVTEQILGLIPKLRQMNQLRPNRPAG